MKVPQQYPATLPLALALPIFLKRLECYDCAEISDTDTAAEAGFFPIRALPACRDTTAIVFLPPARSIQKVEAESTLKNP